MAKLGKFLGITAVIGAVAGGIAYFKKKENCASCDTDTDTDDEKIFNVDTDFTDEDRKYVSITINSKKAKDTISDAKEVIEDFASKAKDKVVDIVGEENMDNAKDAVADFADDAKDWAKDSAKKAMSYASEAKDKIKDSVSRHTQDTYEFDEDEISDDDTTSETTETGAAQENGDDFLTEEIDDEING